MKNQGVVKHEHNKSKLRKPLTFMGLDSIVYIW